MGFRRPPRYSDGRNCQWLWLYNRLLDDCHAAAMGPHTWAVYTAITRSANDVHLAEASVAWLVHVTGVSKSQVLRGRAWLVEHGYLRIHAEGNSRYAATVYVLVEPPQIAPATGATQTPVADEMTGATQTPVAGLTGVTQEPDWCHPDTRPVPHRHQSHNKEKREKKNKTTTTERTAESAAVDLFGSEAQDLAAHPAGARLLALEVNPATVRELLTRHAGLTTEALVAAVVDAEETALDLARAKKLKTDVPNYVVSSVRELWPAGARVLARRQRALEAEQRRQRAARISQAQAEARERQNSELLAMRAEESEALAVGRAARQRAADHEAMIADWVKGLGADQRLRFSAAILDSMSPEDRKLAEISAGKCGGAAWRVPAIAAAMFERFNGMVHRGGAENAEASNG